MNTNTNQSNFVSIVAWIFIILSGFAVLLSTMQNLMIHSFPLHDMHFFNDSLNENFLFRIISIVFSNLKLFIFFNLLLYISVFISSVGLLKRKKWARKTFIGFLLLGCILIALAIVFNFAITSSFEKNNSEIDHFIMTFKIFTTLFYTLIGLVFVWIIKRLNSDSIKKEFN